MQRIILASGSLRRRELLARLGVEFEVRESGYDETLVKTDDPTELVEALSLQKAQAVAKIEPDAIVIGGDTVVFVEGKIVGKPRDRVEAEKILRLLSGTRHQVLSGVAVVNSLTGEQRAGHEVGQVRFKKLSEEEIAKYVKSGVWEGFAGGYAIQGAASSFVTEQTGSISAIVGLPVALVVDLLELSGVVIEVDPRELEDQMKQEGKA